MLVVASDRHRRHAPRAEIEASGLQAPFEHPGRADAIRHVLRADERFRFVEPVAHGTAPILAVHDAGLVSFLEGAWAAYQVEHPDVHDVVPDVMALDRLTDGMDDVPGSDHIDVELGRWTFETTTPITAGTFDAACGAVDIAVTAIDAVLAGERSVYGLCRPPGHHAAERLYGGYCFFNNAAVAAQRAVTTAGTRVSVLDVDYHHGNGTQQIFYRRGDVQYVSLHADPDRAYPYVTGRTDETGSGPGRGTNHNVPLPAGTSDERYLAALRSALDAIEAFRPGLLVVSLGVDTHVDDPICDLGLTTAGIGAQGAAVAELDLPTVVLQEGGYDLASIGPSVAGFLGPFADPTAPNR